MDTRTRPTTGPAWMRWVEREVKRASTVAAAARRGSVPIGGMVLYAPTDAPPAAWLVANGATFTADDYPLLAQRLGATTTPNPTQVSGMRWIIRGR